MIKYMMRRDIIPLIRMILGGEITRIRERIDSHRKKPGIQSRV